MSHDPVTCMYRYSSESVSIISNAVNQQFEINDVLPLETDLIHVGKINALEAVTKIIIWLHLTKSARLTADTEGSLLLLLIKCQRFTM